MSLKKRLQLAIACDSVGKPESVFGRTICLSAHPGKMLLFPFMHWFNKHYRSKYAFARMVFGFDLLLIGSLIGLCFAFLLVYLHSPTRFVEKITFEATIAPIEIITGAPSTLMIRLTNGTDEPLRNANLELGYPDHFLLQELLLENQKIETQTIALGDISIGDSRSIHVRGVMFGDVGGEQTFTSNLNFVHGTKRDIHAKKTDTYSFSPVASTLNLTLSLPDALIAFQPMKGTLTYHNTGEIDFPTISIAPEWPDGFLLQSSNAATNNGAFELPAIKAGQEGSMEFSGYLGDVGDEVTFSFLPSFTFNKTRYLQETLTHTAPVVPPQVKIEHSVAKESVQPGATTSFTIRYENIGEFAVSNVVLGIESESPFFKKDLYEVESANYPELASLDPGESGEVVVTVPLRQSILQSETDIYENLDLTTRATASYTLGDGTGQRVASKGSSIVSPITSPVMLESFGRYAAASGDQLGRGPLPPRVGLETKYWVFWHLDGTSNDLENVKIEGALGKGVRFTGRQTSSQNSGVEYDEENGEITWNAELIKPTLSPMSKIVGVAFELGITPTEGMLGTSPTLIDQIHITATDARTGAFVSATGSPVTTNLPQDSMATGKSIVEN